MSIETTITINRSDAIRRILFAYSQKMARINNMSNEELSKELYKIENLFLKITMLFMIKSQGDINV